MGKTNLRYEQKTELEKLTASDLGKVKKAIAEKSCFQKKPWQFSPGQLFYHLIGTDPEFKLKLSLPDAPHKVNGKTVVWSAEKQVRYGVNQNLVHLYRNGFLICFKEGKKVFFQYYWGKGMEIPLGWTHTSMHPANPKSSKVPPTKRPTHLREVKKHEIAVCKNELSTSSVHLKELDD